MQTRRAELLYEFCLSDTERCHRCAGVKVGQVTLIEGDDIGQVLLPSSHMVETYFRRRFPYDVLEMDLEN
jgi:hypothetical protein